MTATIVGLLPMILPLSLYPALLKAVVATINCLPNPVNMLSVSAINLIEGCKPAYNCLIRSGFGQHVLVKKPTLKRKLNEASAEFGLAVGSEMNQSEKTLLWIPEISRSETRLFDRNNFSPTAMDQTHLEIINSIARTQISKRPEVPPGTIIRYNEDSGAYRVPAPVPEPNEARPLRVLREGNPLGHMYQQCPTSEQ